MSNITSDALEKVIKLLQEEYDVDEQFISLMEDENKNSDGEKYLKVDEKQFKVPDDADDAKCEEIASYINSVCNGARKKKVKEDMSPEDKAFFEDRMRKGIQIKPIENPDAMYQCVDAYIDDNNEIEIKCVETALPEDDPEREFEHYIGVPGSTMAAKNFEVTMSDPYYSMNAELQQKVYDLIMSGYEATEVKEDAGAEPPVVDPNNPAVVPPTNDTTDSVAAAMAAGVPTVPVNERVKIAEEADSPEIKKGEIYKYEPKYLGDGENEAKLKTISQFKPLCRVVDTVITSKDEGEEPLIVVTFDIEENKNLGMPDFTNEEFIVFATDLSTPEVNGEAIDNGESNKTPVKESFEGGTAATEDTSTNLK